ncbi:MAG TPA: ABC transporter permease [Candidatus Moranbacteria bacterium]|nr:ABC transporter permease [Candidatus Moranbacteria bacterium]HRY27959.1 ABC transporter permease [Candidatus Moranbacteria bacterium]HSA08225.1 ABC transporter permease [Candidatus Moranbacteria bacterium]
MLKDLLKETIWSLSANKVRSGLTILGIVIGIASVIALVAIGQGAQNSIEKNIEAIGSNLIMISPGAQRIGGINQGGGSAQSLTVEDAEAIKNEIENVKAVAPTVTKRSQITAKGNNTNTQVIGTTEDYLIVRNVAIDSGSFFSQQQMKGSAKVAVIGPTTRDDLFGAEIDPVGKIIRINKMDFTVIGMTITKGGSGFNNQDDVVYVPLTTAQHYLSGDEYVNSISVAASDQNSMTAVQEQISTLLLARHKISDPADADFSMMNQNDIIATATSITGTFTILLSSIAGISLLVGGIGIMNMMLTTVTERTREIGLRKAVGIRKLYINLQFLAEAVILTFLGGALGIVLGWIMSLLVTRFISSLTTSISLSSIFLAFGVSAGVGIVFGFYPARRAANLSPIEALRYE